MVSVVNLQLGSVAAAAGNMMVSQTDDEHIELFLGHTFKIKLEIFLSWYSSWKPTYLHVTVYIIMSCRGSTHWA